MKAYSFRSSKEAQDVATGEVWLQVRVFDGVPVLYTDDGRKVRGVRGVKLCGHVDSAVWAEVEALVARPED